MKNNKYITIPELADIMGISRIAVYKKVKKGQIKAVKIGRNFAIPKKYVSNILGKSLDERGKNKINKAIKRTVKEYGEVLKRLGRE
ncbi:MAG: helix-turn-helix domain-containing protein [Candidatus Omnitrophota bacterium]|nr:helix-turn-helix domain-containing protein [Candidatus Omnitrophota bacterium]